MSYGKNVQVIVIVEDCLYFTWMSLNGSSFLGTNTMPSPQSNTIRINLDDALSGTVVVEATFEWYEDYVAHVS